MFDNYLLIIVLFFAGGAVLLLVAIPWAISTSENTQINNESWQDSSGSFIKMVRPLLRMYSASAEENMAPEKSDRIKKKLQISGLGYIITPAEFFVLKRLSAIVTALLAGLVIWLSGTTDILRIILILLSLAVLGYVFPDIRVRDFTKQRQLSIEKHFPFFLDLVVLSMRAGLPFTGAVQQGIEKMVSGPLKDELLRYQREVRTGIERKDALERFATRIDLSSVTNFVASIIQAEESGGGVTGVLQDQARQRRKERFLRAEKLANEAPVKMLLPLVGLLFPLTFMIIAVPIVVQFMESGLLGKML
ncbi:type II secretion system F family protein [Amphritea balenae]|uniref:Type II secretion system protein GspF domain-containing protein n=1 Tax=Amphritea balenae TaxID=452629 RepID=A0A3P1SNR5_9GAMM|nr:type II secretion system F family protein [Amphritea balenae]RRC98594.1 hypothetical protein EHS89_13365 [Amphritea balenae]GGK65816.1 hypothetical protein GCM10007941_15000 [Amphritea balenae]